MFDDLNLSIASLPITLLLSALPHWYTIGLAQSNKVNGGWTNQNPRAFVARLNAKAAMGKKLSEVEEKVLRGQSAQQNGFEWWAVWAIAVVCLRSHGYIQIARANECAYLGLWSSIETADKGYEPLYHDTCRG